MSLTVAILKAQNYAEWMAVRAKGEAAGNIGPYSVDELEKHGFDVRYSDATFAPPWAWSLLERGLGWLGRRMPELLGIRNALANRRLIAGADVTLGIFEDQGSFAAFARSRRLPWIAPRRMALIVCWMAELVRDADERTLRGYRRVLAGADLVVCFSENQRETFARLGVPPGRLLTVPFGIDQHFFAGRPPRDDGYVLAVGGDRSRDHELLVEAVRGTAIQTRIHAPELSVGELPPNVTWVSEPMSHVQYRDALAGATVVVIPTKGTAYPGGQTVLLEAMASSKPVVTTDSAAMRDYVGDGLNGLLVPRGDAQALREAIERVLGDGALRASLSANARAAVGERFNQAAMWSAIAERLHGVLMDRSR